MTQEEKAKLYDKVIERATKHRNNDGLTLEQYETIDIILPELTESDDEKIRKALHIYLDWIDGKKDVAPRGEYSIRDMIAWVMKQNPANTDNKFIRMRETKPANIVEFLDRLTTVEQEFLWEHIEKVKKVDREEREQNPAWSEEDELKIDFISKLILGLDQEKYDSQCMKELADWLKSLKDRVQPQQRQEWSQNDIDMIDWLIRCCEKEHEELCNDKYGHQDIVSDLKRDCRKKWNWLESLKNKVVPQNTWKPSDEQMSALEKECIAHSNYELCRLLEQLKKL